MAQKKESRGANSSTPRPFERLFIPFSRVLPVSLRTLRFLCFFLPGKVVKILTKIGADVEESTALIIVEAMKMENELTAPKAGKVSKIMVKEGQAVESGAPLVSVE